LSCLTLEYPLSHSKLLTSAHGTLTTYPISFKFHNEPPHIILTVDMPRHFLDLPREIRDRVYHELWSGNSDINLSPSNYCLEIFSEFHPEPPHWLNTYLDPPQQFHSTSGLPNWLLTSKAILEEAMEVFDRFGRVYVGTGAKYLSHSKYDRTFDSRGWEESQYNTATFPALLPPFSCRRLFLQFLVPDHVPAPTAYLPLIYWDIRDIRYARKLFEDVNRAGKLKELDIRVQAITHLPDTDYRVDLAPVANLVTGAGSPLDRLEVFIGTDEDDVVWQSATGALETMEELIWTEVQQLDAGVLGDMVGSAVGGMIGARMYNDEVLRGWSFVWTRK